MQQFYWPGPLVGPERRLVHRDRRRKRVTPLPGTIAADPQFVDVAARNFRVMATSPAVDMAVPSIFGLASTPDLDGTERPQGPKPDIGAYELKP